MDYAFDEQIGTRRVNGTDWPIRLVVYKQGRRWVVARICNGVCENSWEARTKGEALAIAKAEN
jgi:hypothetical protein